MGCGASKSAQVVNTEITTKGMPSPPRQTSSGGQGEPLLENSTPLSSSHLTPNERGGQVTSTVAEYTSAGAGDITDKEEGSKRETGAGSLAPNGEVQLSASSERYAAFEVDMAINGQTRMPPPRRLDKLVGAPRVTLEMLTEKQKAVQERKDKALEERSSSMRLSKKERLRKEIMESRKLASIQSGSSQNEPKLIVKEASKDSLPKMDHSNDYNTDEVVEMEVDQTYNDDAQMDNWEGDSNDSQEDNSTMSPNKRHTLDIPKPDIRSEAESFDDWDSTS